MYFVTNQRLARRTFLRGLGTTLLNLFDVRADAFGDSTGRLEGIHT